MIQSDPQLCGMEFPNVFRAKQILWVHVYLIGKTNKTQIKLFSNFNRQGAKLEVKELFTECYNTDLNKSLYRDSSD